MHAPDRVRPVPADQRQEWRSGWTLVLASSVGFSFFSVLLAATGLFFEPLGKEFGWSRSVLSAGPGIATFVTALLSPFYGALIDRMGSRRLALPGIVLVMISMSAFALANGSEVQWLVMWGVFGLVVTSIKSTVWTTAVAGLFEKGRGLALGVTVAGTAVAQAVVPPLGNFLIDYTGWRGAFVWFAIGWGGLTLLLCALFLYDVHDRARRAAQKSGGVVAARSTLHLPGLTPREALRSRAMWQLGLSTFLVMVLTVGLGIHLFPILTEAGVTRTNAAWLTALTGVAGIIGKLVTGALLDRYRPNWIGGVTMGVTAVTFLVLIGAINSTAAVIFGLLVNGYAAGTKTQICAYLTAGYAGMRHFGAIYGVMAAMVAFASGLGPWLAGVVYDKAGNYGPFLWAGVIGCVVSGLLLVTLPAYPKWEEREQATD
ncbi:putative MFS family arabinose efflux permease [Novosphingobium sp. PhB165]|uniref:MFS transporter n=1 Tax=Novosphingobium sp. PhB165 TaxID=2485105 RepID=UPI001045E896|nr:MFS transporter [Novosphingobium sp. PhB165]TCM19540.1 putative MFS family arabinose efflux permease [Novosphingobium sp. PhB165]